jgi:cytochrome c oxidase subunit 1
LLLQAGFYKSIKTFMKKILLSLLIGAQLIFVWCIVRCMRRKGEKATAQVWDGAEGLEWEIPSPAPYHTFQTPPHVK